MNEDIAPADHNQGPPNATAALKMRLAEQHADDLKSKADLLERYGRAPEEVEDDKMAGTVSDFINEINTAVKSANISHKVEKEPFLTGGRTVDAWFKGITEPLVEAKDDLLFKLTVYDRAKAATERRRREAEEKAAQEVAMKAAKEAAAKEAAIKAEADRIAAIEAERVAAQLAAAKTEQDRIAAIEAKDAADRAAAVKAEQDQAEIEAAKDTAAQAFEVADETVKAARGSNADMSRNRGRSSVSSLRTDWKGELTDRAELDLNALRQHLPEKALESAINSFVKAGGRELAGARIFEYTRTAVR